MKYKRILLKVSGEAMGADGNVIDFHSVDLVAGQIAELSKMGVEIGIVIGGGNIWRGRSSGEMDRSRADHMGMLATVINALALQDSLEKLSVPCAVMSAVGMDRFCDTFTVRSAKAALQDGKVVIFAAGTGCPFFSTDTAAALRAAEIGADALLCAKNIDAVYSADPKLCPDAVRFSHLTYEETIERNLKALDLTAITLCAEQHIPVLVFAMKEAQNIRSAVNGLDVGTLID